MLSRDDDTHLTVLGNGVRALAIRLPQRSTVHVGVFVHTGSQHESRSLNGISHLVEHMAFKGTHQRDCQRINLDAERLGAEVNAYTDKDHSAFHMVGLARDAERFVQMLGDIVQNCSFPADELERERQVILHEFVEDEDDAMSTAFKLFDRTCFGAHPVAQPVIGSRRNIRRFSRADLLAYVQRQYTGANIVVAAAGDVDPERVARQVQHSFGAMARGSENRVPAPAYAGGIASRRLAGCPQTHIVLGFPIPALPAEHHAGVVAAALFGEGMSSPLLDQLRERRALVYHAACSADVMELCGQFVIEASTSPEHVDEFFVAVTQLLARHAETTDAVGLERARNQIAVRRLRAHDRPSQRLETAAQDLFALGRLRAHRDIAAALEAVTADQVREAFAGMIASGPSIGIAGKVQAGLNDRVLELLRPVLAPAQRKPAGISNAR